LPISLGENLTDSHQSVSVNNRQDGQLQVLPFQLHCEITPFSPTLMLTSPLQLGGPRSELDGAVAT
jgi:hypothetical protein